MKASDKLPINPELSLIERMPPDIILACIAQFLTPLEICRLRRTSKKFNHLFATHFKEINTALSPVKQILAKKLTGDITALEEQKNQAAIDKKKATQESVGTIQSFFSLGHYGESRFESTDTQYGVAMVSGIFLVSILSLGFVLPATIWLLIDQVNSNDALDFDSLMPIGALVVLSGILLLSSCSALLLCGGDICRNTASFFNSTNRKSNAEHRILILDDALKRVEAGQATSTLPDASMNAAAAAAVCLTDADETTPLLRTTSARP